jgi:hypothetical protein
MIIKPDEVKINNIVIGSPWLGSFNEKVLVTLDVDLYAIVDSLEFHDFPSFIDINLNLEEVKKLRDYLNLLIPNMEAMEKKEIK